MDVTILVFLILLNGLCAMSEMALTGGAQGAPAGDGGKQGSAARSLAMELHENPTRCWLSTVQIGITSIGVLNGIVGENAFSQPLAHWLVDAPSQVRRAHVGGSRRPRTPSSSSRS